MKGKFLISMLAVLAAGLSVGAMAKDNINTETVLVGAVDNLGEVSKGIDSKAILSNKAVVSKDSSFAYNINAQMNQDENYVFSPYSLKSVLAMAANGANGDTRDELLSALGYDSVDSLNADMRVLNNRYNSDGELKISAANSLWLNSTCPDIASDYSKEMQNYYDATVEKAAIDVLPVKIKAWVAEKSNGLQKNFNARLDDSFVMGFVNTTYLKAKWTNEFESRATYEDVFYNSDGTNSNTYFMHDSGYRMAYKDDEVTMLRLNYRDDDRNMSFYAAIAPENVDLEKYVDKLESKRVVLSLPKFKSNTNMSLNDVVKSLGVNTMFTSAADFGGIFKEDTELYVSSIIQDTVIDVDEQGTEAASTTMMMLDATSALEPEPPLEMNFNKPFTYFIMDNDSGEILFMGRYAKVEQN